MADPLSISASVAGLITIADIVIRRGYKYVSAVRDADKAVSNLISETNLLYGTLHSLRNIAEGLERGNAAFVSTTRVSHVEACYRTLQKITKILDKFESSTTTGSSQHVKNRLKWPLAQSETKVLLEEVRGHREVLSLALNADEMSALIRLLARQDIMGDELSAMRKGLEEDRSERKEVKMTEERLKMLDWLCPPDVDPEINQKAALYLRQAGTGLWFLDGVEFQEWKLKNNSALWIHGIPGAGKTIIMSTIVQELQKGIGSDEGLAYFYCDYKDTKTHQPTLILGSITKQFALQTEEAIQLLTAFYETHRQPTGRHRPPDLEPLLEHLYHTMELFATATVVIDGLDEIAGDRWDTIDLLRRIRRDDSNTRTIYSSRKETDIEGCLSEYDTVSIVAQSCDLALYVASEIEKRTRKRQLSIKDLNLKETIMNRLINGADGMFRWVACQIDHLCELPNDKARSKALDNLPRGLPETYERILHRALERHEDIRTFVARTFQWLSFSQVPLSSQELLLAISVNPGDTTLDPTTVPSEDDLLTWCSSLVRKRASGDGIEFAHFTVEEYLLSISNLEPQNISIFAQSEDEAELYIGRTCLTYLLFDDLGKAPPSDDIFPHLDDDNYTSNDLGNSRQPHKTFIFYKRNLSDDSSNPRPSNEISELDERTLRFESDNAPPPDETFVDFDEEKEEGLPYKLFNQQLEQYPLCYYAASFWYMHLQEDLNNCEIVRLTHKLFNPEKSNNFIWFCYSVMTRYDDVNWQNSYANTTTLHWAALLSLEEVSSWLISKKCDVNRKSLAGTPLHCALRGSEALCRRTKTFLPHTYMGAERRVQTAIAKNLIGAGANIDGHCDSYSRYSPLAWALYGNFSDESLIITLSGGGNAIDDSALEMVDLILKDQIGKNVLPSLVTLFSVVSHKDVPENVQEKFLNLSKQVCTPDLVVSKMANVEKEAMAPDDRLKALRVLFMQAAEHGMKSELAHLISDMQRLVSEEEHLRILTDGLAVILEYGQDGCLKTLLSRGADPKMTDENGCTALHLALKKGTIVTGNAVTQTVETLLEFGADFTIQNHSGELPLHVAAKSKNLLRELHTIMDSASFQLSLSIEKPSVLSYAMENGSDDDVEFLLGKYENIDFDKHISKAGNNILTLAAFRKTPFAMELLLKRGTSTNVHTLDADGTSILYNASASRSKEVFDYLLKLGTIDNSSKHDGWRAIHEVSNKNEGSEMYNAKLDALLQAGEDPNIQTADGSSALHFTMLSFPSTQLLCCQEGININLQNHEGLTPLMIYLDGLASYLHKGGLLPPLQPRYGDNGLKGRTLASNIKYLLDQGADTSLTDKNGRTALHHLLMRTHFSWKDGQDFLQKGSFDILKAIVSSGGSLTSKSHMGERPFDQILDACIRSDEECSRPVVKTWTTWFDKSLDLVLNFILNNVTEEFLEKCSVEDTPPLNLAIEHNSMRVAAILLTRNGIDVDRRGETDFCSAVELAAELGCTKEIAQILLSRTTTSVHAQSSSRGYSLLHCSVLEKTHQTMLKLLLERKIDGLQLPTRGQSTPLQLAISEDNAAAVELLVEAGVDIHIPFPDTFSPLHTASGIGSLGIVRALDKHGADINAQLPVSKATPLHVASCSPEAQWDVCSYLIDRGADMYALDSGGFSPYFAAAYYKRWDIVEKYMNLDINLDKTTADGWGLLEWAILHGKNTIMKELLHRGKFQMEIRNEEGKLTSNSLMVAINSGNEEAFDILWNDDHINFTNDHGWTLAHFAMITSNEEVRNRLLSLDIAWNVSTATPYSRGRLAGEMGTLRNLTPLHIAAWGGRSAEGRDDPAIAFLFKNKLVADVNELTLSEHRYSALHLATIFNRLSAVKLLHSYGIDLELTDGIDHQTALHHAAKRGFRKIVSVLLEAGCKPNELDIHGMTPELLAIENGHQSVIGILNQHLDALEAKKSASHFDSLSAEYESNYASDTSTSTNDLSTPPKKLWRLPLHRGPNMRRIMTEDVSIYAINEKECPEELRKMLEEHEGKHVDALGKPYRRLV